jgi:hypothetical protein
MMTGQNHLIAWGHLSACGFDGLGVSPANQLFDPIRLFTKMVSEPAQDTRVGH